MSSDSIDHATAPTFIYRHKKTGQVAAMSMKGAAIFETSFDRPNWKHTATICAHTWLSHFLNKSPRERREALRELTE